MNVNRRQALATLGFLGATRVAAAQEQWWALVGDDGKPASNMRLPVELTSEMEDLGGLFWIGSSQSDVSIVEFFDYNCPYCRKVVGDIQMLMQADRSLRVGLVNNPILSPMSLQAAKVELAVLALRGQAAAYEFHHRLFAKRGGIDGPKALVVAEAFGLAKRNVEEVADGPVIQRRLADQMRLAASLGIAATPSFVIAGAGVFGYPGPKAFARIVGSVRQCDQIVC